MDIIHNITKIVLDFFGGLGYESIFFLMALESSLFPVPSEAVMIPAGYLVKIGKLNFFLSFLAGTLGSGVGASFNYLIGKYIGRPFITKFGKYFLIKEEKYNEAEKLFLKNNKLYTFIGRLIPVVRHLISIPAGIFRMNYLVFLSITLLGAGLWVFILMLIGYYFGEGVVDIFSRYTKEVSIAIVLLIVLGTTLFLKKKSGQKKKDSEGKRIKK